MTAVLLFVVPVVAITAYGLDFPLAVLAAIGTGAALRITRSVAT